jgi:UDP-N-acetylmuramoyl-L-alanyl-D-glutamate--2,6-diaminopimelate ligase
MRKMLKRLLPESIFNSYYYSLAILGSFIYNSPSKRMIVIGVTGTKGKTSTINFIWSCLMAAGYKTGIISTANIRIGDKEVLNKYHMTMPGRFVISKLMSQMAKSGCKFCIVETTSEGIKQHRNAGIIYDIFVFTNLYPEHLPSHDNSFEKYKYTKSIPFRNLSNTSKIIDGKKIDRMIIVNKDSEHGDYYLQFNADKKSTYSIINESDNRAQEIVSLSDSVKFRLNGEEYTLKILGEFNIYNALPAIIIAKEFDISYQNIKNGLLNLNIIPGRMELIEAGQNYTVIVDYAHEKESMTNVLKTAVSIRKSPTSKIIVLLGAEGGGRDKSKRPLMGRIAAEYADYVIVANVDPYEDDPKEILEDIALAAEKNGKIRNKNLFVIEDREQAIIKSLSLAKQNDIVIITGKGAEQSIVIEGKSMPWDDRTVVKNAIINLLKK